MAGDYGSLVAALMNQKRAALLAQNPFYAAGQAVQQTQLPAHRNPWASIGAAAAQGFSGGLATAYGQNQAREQQDMLMQQYMQAQQSPDPVGAMQANPQLQDFAWIEMQRQAAAKAKQDELMQKEMIKAQFKTPELQKYQQDGMEVADLVHGLYGRQRLAESPIQQTGTNVAFNPEINVAGPQESARELPPGFAGMPGKAPPTPKERNEFGEQYNKALNLFSQVEGIQGVLDKGVKTTDLTGPGAQELSQRLQILHKTLASATGAGANFSESEQLMLRFFPGINPARASVGDYLREITRGALGADPSQSLRVLKETLQADLENNAFARRILPNYQELPQPFFSRPQSPAMRDYFTPRAGIRNNQSLEAPAAPVVDAQKVAAAKQKLQEVMQKEGLSLEQARQRLMRKQ